MSLDLSGLQAIKEKKPRAKKEWAPLDLADLVPGTYLAADPSLSAFGLVMFTVTEERKVLIQLAQQFHTAETGDRHWADVFTRAAQMEAKLTAFIAHWAATHDWGDVQAVHEMPPEGGGKIRSIESSLFGSYVFRKATAHLPQLPYVPRTNHARLWTANPTSKKSSYHTPMKDYLPRFIGSDLITNEAKRDALSVGLFAARSKR